MLIICLFSSVEFKNSNYKVITYNISINSKLHNNNFETQSLISVKKVLKIYIKKFKGEWKFLTHLIKEWSGSKKFWITLFCTS